MSLGLGLARCELYVSARLLTVTYIAFPSVSHFCFSTDMCLHALFANQSASQ